MARKTMAKGDSILDFSESGIEMLFEHAQVRFEGDEPKLVVFSFLDKPKSPICIYDHRASVVKAVLDFIDDAATDTANALVGAFMSDAFVKIITSRIGGEDRPAINLQEIHGPVDSVLSVRAGKKTLLQSPSWSFVGHAGKETINIAFSKF